MHIEGAETDDTLALGNAGEHLDMGGVRFPQFDSTTSKGLTAVLHEDNELTACLDYSLPGHRQPEGRLTDTQ